MLAPANAPAGCGAIQLEVYHSRKKPLTQSPESLPARVVEELVQLNILRDKREVLWARHREIPYANVIFDHARTPALAVIRPWLEAHGILTAGRYGEWGYHWTDDATKAGWAAAEKILLGK
jgi:protoporphyrinogen oxidase